MKKEIINVLTWLANRVTETTQYDKWPDEFARKEIREAVSKAHEELKKHIDWNNLTEEDCNQLRFGRWQSKEDVQEEIDNLGKQLKDGKINQEQYNKAVQNEMATVGIRLIPLWLFPILPIGQKVICISGEEIVNDGKNLDDDIRFGCVAYGIKVKE